MWNWLKNYVAVVIVHTFREDLIIDLGLHLYFSKICFLMLNVLLKGIITGVFEKSDRFPFGVWGLNFIP